MKLNKIIEHQVNELCGINYFLYCLFDEYECVLAEDMADRMAKRNKDYGGKQNEGNLQRRKSFQNVGVREKKKGNISLGGNSHNSRLTIPNKNSNNPSKNMTNPYLYEQS